MSEETQTERLDRITKAISDAQTPRQLEEVMNEHAQIVAEEAVLEQAHRIRVARGEVE